MPDQYQEEHFGILTDDDLYLDCLLIRPPGSIPDEEIRSIRVWVPKFPLTKSSTIVCARQEVIARGPQGRSAHLVFDLRGTGQSDGSAEDKRYDIDLRSIRAWAKERFPAQSRLLFLGTPDSKFSRINLLPLRSGVVLESYHYRARGVAAGRPLLYLSTFGNFDRADDVRCGMLAQAGYDVYGMDPLRYLLHASTFAPLRPENLIADLETVVDILGLPPLLVGQPLGAGLALYWAAQGDLSAGVIAIGHAQNAFRAAHIFAPQDAARFELKTYIGRISPRPVVLIWHEGHPLGGTPREMADLFQAAGEPKHIVRAQEISPQLLLDQLEQHLPPPT